MSIAIGTSVANCWPLGVAALFLMIFGTTFSTSCWFVAVFGMMTICLASVASGDQAFGVKQLNNLELILQNQSIFDESIGLIRSGKIN